MRATFLVHPGVENHENYVIFTEKFFEVDNR